jgi:uncharacterized delta-60 repeat protein
MWSLSSMMFSPAQLSLRAAASVGLFAFAALSLANPPILDDSFGADGTVYQAFAGLGGSATSILLQRGGRIVAAGTYIAMIAQPRGIAVPHSATVRYNADGSLDRSFGDQGVSIDDVCQRFGSMPPMLMQRDNKIVCMQAKGLARLNQDGLAESGYIIDGAAGFPWFSNLTYRGMLAQQADGKVIAAGPAYPQMIAVVRFNSDGSLESPNSAIVPYDDAVDDDFAALALQPDGKLVVAASGLTSVMGLDIYGYVLIRINADGTPDLTFGQQGRVFAPAPTGVYRNARSLALQPGGRLIVAGVEHDTRGGDLPPLLMLSGFTANGAVDMSFGTAGQLRIPYDVYVPPATSPKAYSVSTLALPDGKFLAAYGPLYNANRLMRFTADGTPDADFGDAGLLIPLWLQQINAIGLQPDGNLILGGEASGYVFSLQRYLSGTVPAIEFHNAALDHYFLSMDWQEVEDLDLGVHGGWKRTGLSFPVYGSLAAATAAAAGVADHPVCRFYIPPQHGDSHFFSANPVECAIARSSIDPNFSGYIEETVSAYFVGVANPTTGNCPDETMPVYRLWNARVDSNHRYTTDSAIKAQMIARGYVSEGSGPDGVAMCAPH